MGQLDSCAPPWHPKRSLNATHHVSLCQHRYSAASITQLHAITSLQSAPHHRGAGLVASGSATASSQARRLGPAMRDRADRWHRSSRNGSTGRVAQAKTATSTAAELHAVLAGLRLLHACTSGAADSREGALTCRDAASFVLMAHLQRATAQARPMSETPSRSERCEVQLWHTISRLVARREPSHQSDRSLIRTA